MTTADFIDLVRRMREAQRDYFRNRTPVNLDAAKTLERQIDAALAELAKLPALFPEEPKGPYD